jgi:hypothetical protein
MVLSADSDLVAALAQELSCLVIGAGAETVSGTFWLTAADGAGLRRVYFHVLATMTEPFTRGDPLPSEAAVEWTDIDGAGILARLADLGVPAEVLERGPTLPGRRVTWDGDHNLPASGPLSAQIDHYTQQHTRPDADDWMKNISVQARGSGGFDITARPSAKPRGSRLRRLFPRRR